jgi:hypothetical protein
MGFHIKLLAVFVLTYTGIFAQTKNWITQKSKDGSVTVKSCISDNKNEKGDKFSLIEYTTSATLNVDFKKCIVLMKNVSKHKAFLHDTKESKMIKTISENLSVVYYSFNAPWPFADYDCVTKMSIVEGNNTSVFTIVADPTLYKKTDFDRLTNYEMSYQFKDLSNGKVEITIIGKMSPLIKIPLWMLRNTMPDRPAETLQKIAILANEI